MQTFESLCVSHHNSVVHLTIGPQTLPKRVLHRVPSSASSFNFQYPLFFLRYSSSCLRLLHRLPVTSIAPSITCFRIQFLRNIWPIQIAFLLFPVCKISSFLDSMWDVLISHTISPTDLHFLHHHISQLPRHFCSTFEVSKFQHYTTLCL
jgi:hypothetical protein